MAITTKATTTKQPTFTGVDVVDNLISGGSTKPVDPYKAEKASCAAKGGKWDPITNSCILPTAIPQQTEQLQPSPNEQLKQDVKKAGGYIDETGKYIPSTQPTTKINFKNDGTIEYTPKGSNEAITLSREEYKALQGKAGGKTTQDVNQIKAIEGGALDEIKRKQAISEIGLTPEEIAAAQAAGVEAPVDVGQAAAAGLSGAAPAALGAAAGGLLAGSGALAATGVGAPAAVGTLAVAGGLYAVSKLWNGINSNLKQQQAGEIGAAKDVLTAAKLNMRMVAKIAKTDPQKAVEVYDKWLAETYKAQAKLKRETSGNLDKFLNDGTQDLSDFEVFLEPNGQAENLKYLIQQAALSNYEVTEEELNSVLGE